MNPIIENPDYIICSAFVANKNGSVNKLSNPKQCTRRAKENGVCGIHNNAIKRVVIKNTEVKAQRECGDLFEISKKECTANKRKKKEQAKAKAKDIENKSEKGERAVHITTQTIRGIIYFTDTPIDNVCNIYKTEDILREIRNPVIIGTYNISTAEYAFTT